MHRPHPGPRARVAPPRAQGAGSPPVAPHRGGPVSRRGLLAGAGALLAAGALGIAGCAARPSGHADGSGPVDGSTFAFDTYCTFTVYGDDTALARLSSACARYDALLDLYDEESDIARVNAAGGEAVQVDPDTADLLARALEFCAQADGLFDITIGAVSTLWDFDAGTRPSDEQIAAALPHVGWRGVHVDREASTVRLDDPEAKLDLGGIAKGYVADDLAGLLAGRGVTRFAINLGGNVLVRGGRPGGPGSRAGAPWRIGIVNPLDPAHSRAIVEVADGSVVTSGLHERRFTRGGVTYHHILDPADGMPARTDLTSATIVAARSIDCDGWSTTALMAGSRAALDLIGGLPGIEAVLIDDADRVSWTDGVAERLSLVPTLPRL